MVTSDDGDRTGDFVQQSEENRDSRTRCKRVAWRLAGYKVHGGNAILANKKNLNQAAALTPRPPSKQETVYSRPAQPFMWCGQLGQNLVHTRAA